MPPPWFVPVAMVASDLTVEVHHRDQEYGGHVAQGAALRLGHSWFRMPPHVNIHHENKVLRPWWATEDGVTEHPHHGLPTW